VFKPRSKRGCTDIICLLLFIAFWVYMIVLAVVSINKDPSLLDDLVYPADSYGNNCGKPGSDTAHLDTVIFPKMDADVKEHMPLLVAGQYFTFSKKVTKYCTGSCPSGLSLSNPVAYGGANYPVNNVGSGNLTSVEEIYYSYRTLDILNRCIPRDTTSVYSRQELCTTPSCTNTTLNTTLDGSVSCFRVESEPDVTNVWRICGGGESTELCARQRLACDFQVDMAETETFAPHEQTSESDYYTKLFASYVQRGVGLVDGLLDSDGTIACLLFGLVMPLVLGFVWAIFLRYLAAVCVYTLIILMVLVMVLISLYFATKAGWLDDAQDATIRFSDAANAVLNGTGTSSILATANEEDQMMYAAFAVISIALTAIAIIVLIMSRKNIQRLIAIIEECTKIFKDMFYIVFWPIGSLVFQALVFLYGVFVFYFLFYVWDEEDLSVQAFIMGTHFFGILWAVQTIRAVTYTSMAYAIANWYVTLNSPKDPKSGGCSLIPKAGLCRLLSALWTVISRHLGSMIFGAAVIAIVQLLQIIMSLIDYATKDQQKKNFLIKLIIKCAHCCLYCLRKTVEFISYYGFVFVAMEGTSFCRACKNTFVFILSNPGQTAINNVIQKLLGLLIGFTTPVGCALLCFYYLEGLEEYNAKYEPMYAAAIVFLCAFLVTDSFVLVLRVAVDTIYLCAFKDMAENAPEDMFMSNSLRKGFGFDAAPKADSGDDGPKSGKIAPSK